LYSEVLFIYDYDVDEEEPEDFKITSLHLTGVTKFRNQSKLFNEVTQYIDKKTIIVGRSGIGKSTLLKIMSGAYRKYSGEVYINNKNLKDYSSKFLSSIIFYLGQYDYLFTDTVFENIKLFSEIDMNEFASKNVFQILYEHNIELDKVLKNNGANLSKGQRQIVNFIATFFIKRDVFIIDESLSNVDEPTVIKLFEMFYEIHKDSLIVLCTHNENIKSTFTNVVEVT